MIDRRTSTPVAYQGEPGAFSEDVARSIFGDDASLHPLPDFAQVAEAVQAGSARFGVLPVENSVAGPIAAATNAIADRALRVLAEITSPIHLCLLAKPGARLDQIRRVLSHPVALAQCSDFMTRLAGIECVPFEDTAAAARFVAASADPCVAAVAGHAAARNYGLTILAEHVEDQPDNRTRFVIVTRASAQS